MKKTLNILIQDYYKNNENNLCFTQIVEYYLPTIKYLVSNYKSREDREDMIQEGIFKLFKLLKNHKLDKLLGQSEKKLKAYLRTSIKNEFKDVIKADFKHFGFEITVDFSKEDFTFINLENLLSKAFILEELIKELSKKQKEVMRLVYLSGLKENEVANKLNVCRANVNSLKNKAKKAINANLALNIIGDCETPLYEVNPSKKLYN